MMPYDDQPDMLYRLCRDVKAVDHNDAAWDGVRNWMNSVSIEELQAGATYQGKLATKALQVVCKNRPPVDIVQRIFEVYPNALTEQDAFGWLPLHYACANGSSAELVMFLTNIYPDSKVVIDRRGRTPLHFAVGNEDRSPDPASVRILAETGAARRADENGSLPMHYACAYGASVEVLKILLESVPSSTTAVDFKGRTPLHFAMGNAEKEWTPAIVQLLLEQNPDVVNDKDNEDNLPLQLLANEAKSVPLDHSSERKRENTMKCLDHYLNAIPEPNADFLNALKNLPSWLLDHAVISESVQVMLNEKISQKFPAAFMLLDGISLVLVIIFYQLALLGYLKLRYNGEEEPDFFRTYLGFLYGGVTYFAFREILQMLSLITLDSFSSWYKDFQNCLDVLRIIVVLVSGLVMGDGQTDMKRSIENDQILFAIGTLILFLSFITFLRSISIEFAVFVFAVTYIAKNLVAFMAALLIILLAFSQIFVTLYRNNDMCPEHFPETKLQDLMEKYYIYTNESQYQTCENFHDSGLEDERSICDVSRTIMFCSNYTFGTDPSPAPSFSPSSMFAANEEILTSSPLDLYETWTLTGVEFCTDLYIKERCPDNSDSCIPFCTFKDSFIQVCIMLIGEVDEKIFEHLGIVGQVLYILYGFLVVILLANVLIAIVQAYYGVVRNQRAEIVFWSNRLDFVAETDAISTGVVRLITSICGCGSDDEIRIEDGFSPKNSFSFAYFAEGEFGKGLWITLVDVIESKPRVGCTSEFACNLFSRIVAYTVVIPTWFVLGLFTFGLIWPPQIRQWCFEAKPTKRSAISADAKFGAATEEVMRNFIMESTEFKNDFNEMNLFMKKLR